MRLRMVDQTYSWLGVSMYCHGARCDASAILQYRVGGFQEERGWQVTTFGVSFPSALARVVIRGLGRELELTKWKKSGFHKTVGRWGKLSLRGTGDFLTLPGKRYNQSHFRRISIKIPLGNSWIECKIDVGFWSPRATSPANCGISFSFGTSILSKTVGCSILRNLSAEGGSHVGYKFKKFSWHCIRKLHLKFYHWRWSFKLRGHASKCIGAAQSYMKGIRVAFGCYQESGAAELQGSGSD